MKFFIFSIILLLCNNVESLGGLPEAENIIASSSPYEILGINQNTSLADIKKAYYKKSKEYHPDKHNDKPNDEKNIYGQAFTKIQNAYQQLTAELKKTLLVDGIGLSEDEHIQNLVDRVANIFFTHSTDRSLSISRWESLINNINTFIQSSQDYTKWTDRGKKLLAMYKKYAVSMKNFLGGYTQVVEDQVLPSEIMELYKQKFDLKKGEAIDKDVIIPFTIFNTITALLYSKLAGQLLSVHGENPEEILELKDRILDQIKLIYQCLIKYRASSDPMVRRYLSKIELCDESFGELGKKKQRELADVIYNFESKDQKKWSDLLSRIDEEKKTYSIRRTSEQRFAYDYLQEYVDFIYKRLILQKNTFSSTTVSDLTIDMKRYYDYIDSLLRSRSITILEKQIKDSIIDKEIKVFFIYFALFTLVDTKIRVNFLDFAEKLIDTSVTVGEKERAISLLNHLESVYIFLKKHINIELDSEQQQFKNDLDKYVQYIKKEKAILGLESSFEKKKDETPLPEKDEASLPKKDEASLPKKDEASLPKKDETPLPKKDETPLPKKDETPLPKKGETPLPKKGEASQLKESLESLSRCLQALKVVL
jgi:hypothetical protein